MLRGRHAAATTIAAHTRGFLVRERRRALQLEQVSARGVAIEPPCRRSTGG